MTSKQRRNNFDVTSWRHIDVDTTLFEGCVPALVRLKTDTVLFGKHGQCRKL